RSGLVELALGQLLILEDDEPVFVEQPDDLALVFGRARARQIHVADFNSTKSRHRGDAHVPTLSNGTAAYTPRKAQAIGLISHHRRQSAYIHPDNISHRGRT